jgi:hypothetical protein
MAGLRSRWATLRLLTLRAVLVLRQISWMQALTGAVLLVLGVVSILVGPGHGVSP